MGEYKRTLEVSAETEYWWVRLGELNHLTGPADYPFPDEQGALKFAESCAVMAWNRHKIRREIWVEYPDGRRVRIGKVAW